MTQGRRHKAGQQARQTEQPPLAEGRDAGRRRRPTGGFELVCPDVAGRALGPGDAPLIGGWAPGVVTFVDGGAAEEECVGEGGSAVVLEGAEHRFSVAQVARPCEATARAAVQVVSQRSDRLGVPAAVPTREVICHNCIFESGGAFSAAVATATLGAKDAASR